MTVRYTRSALADLDAIVTYIAEDNPAAAHAVRERTELMADQLSRFPYMGRDSDEPDVRVLTIPHYPYRVFYKVYDNKGEPPRVCRRPFGLSHAAMAGSSSMAW